MKRKSNTSAIILAAALLGAVALISAKINGPTAAPSEEHKEEVEAVKPAEPVAKAKPGDPTPVAPAMTEEQKQKLKAMKAEYEGKKRAESMQASKMKEMKEQMHSRPPVGNPESIEVSSDYYTKNQDGKAGMAVMDKKIALLKEKQKKALEDYKRTHPETTPPLKPMATPGQSANP